MELQQLFAKKNGHNKYTENYPIILGIQISFPTCQFQCTTHQLDVYSILLDLPVGIIYVREWMWPLEPGNRQCTI